MTTPLDADVGQVRNPRLAQSLAVDIQRRGVTIHTDSPITNLLIEQDRCVGANCHAYLSCR